MALNDPTALQTATRQPLLRVLNNGQPMPGALSADGLEVVQEFSLLLDGFKGIIERVCGTGHTGDRRFDPNERSANTLDDIVSSNDGLLTFIAFPPIVANGEDGNANAD
jgi:hypothetical protein